MKHILVGEELAWMMVIENVLVSVDTEQMDRNMSEAWKSSLARCLEVLLRRQGTFKPRIYCRLR